MTHLRVLARMESRFSDRIPAELLERQLPYLFWQHVSRAAWGLF